MEAMRQTWTDDRMDDLVKHVDTGFARVDRQFEKVEAQFEKVDDRFEQVEAKIEAQIENRFAALDRRFEALGTTITRRFDLMLGSVFTTILAAFVTYLLSH